MAIDFYVSISPDDADSVIYGGIVNGSLTGTQIGRNIVSDGKGGICIVSVYEKHYYRAGNRLTLTTIVDNMSGRTHVGCISGGGGEGLFRFDWGASGSFENCVTDVLKRYICG